MHKLIIFIPEDSRECVKDALFEAGAGTLGAYSRCSWECLGVGQFLPQATAIPHIGQPGVVAQVREWRVELLVPNTVLDAVTDALYASHPYEEPAFDLIRVIEPVPRT